MDAEEKVYLPYPVPPGKNVLSFSRKTRNNDTFVCINEVSDTAINLSLAKARHANINVLTDYSDLLPKVNFSKSNLLHKGGAGCAPFQILLQSGV